MLAMAPFLWYPSRTYLQYPFLGSGDFISPINIRESFFYLFFVYNPFSYGGIDIGFLIAAIFPENTLFYILSLFSLTPLISSLLFISIIIFMSEVSMYMFINYILQVKFNVNTSNKRFYATIAGILYGFSPHVMGLIPPGHFRQLIPFAFFPLMLLIFENMLMQKRFYFKHLLYLFVIFLCSAGSFGNIGILYVFSMTFGIYAILTVVIGRVSILKVIKCLLSTICILFISNIWWIISFVDSFKQLTKPEAQFSSANLAVTNAVTKATVLNFFLGKAEYQLYLLKTDYYINSVASIIFIILSIFFLVSLIKLHKVRFVPILLVMASIGIFISKGTQKPFQELFIWLYNHAYGFQIFRRPVSKYYGIFMFFYLTLSIIGLVITTHKFSIRKFIITTAIPFTLIVIYFLFSFINTPYLTPFKIPSYYYHAKEYLIKDNAHKILVLPSTSGMQPIYNKSISNLYTSDFLPHIWRFSMASPDSTRATADEPQKKLINRLMNSIRTGGDFCELTRQLGISHIMVREDLSSLMVVEDKFQNLIQVFNRNRNIQAKKEYFDNKYRGFSIYKLKRECTDNIISVDNIDIAKFDYFIVNPTKIKVRIRGLRNATLLSFLSNYRGSWKIYLNEKNMDFFSTKNKINSNTYPATNIFFEGDEISLFLRKSLAEKFHTVIYEYANGWKIDPNYIKESFSKKYYKINDDGSIDVDLIIYYKTQSLFYFGMTLFFVTCLILFIFITIIYLSKNFFFKRL